MLLFVSDIGYLAVATGSVALGWSILRTALAYWVLRSHKIYLIHFIDFTNLADSAIL
jgi:hypothetical protein